MEQSRRRELLVTLLVELAGCLLIAVGIYNFAVLSQFPLTGFSGIALILYRLAGIPIGVSIIALNLPVALLCYRLLGRRFFLHSLWCMLLSSVMIDYLAPLFPAYRGDRLLAALCCGVVAGVGYAMIYMRGSSVGGSDFIVMAVKAKSPHLSLGKISFAADLLVVVAAGVIFGDFEGMVYGMIINFLFAVAVDKMMYGLNSGKVVMAVTNHSGAVARAIAQTTGRGATIWTARGAFQQETREMVLCACDKKQMYKVQRAVKAADPASFTIVLESNEVHGEGFAPVVIGEHWE